MIHGASVSNEEKYLGTKDQERFDVVDLGARNILKQAEKWGVNKVVMISSGSVYGNSEGQAISEKLQTSPDIKNIESCYSEAKRAAEVRHMIYSRTCGVNVSIARCLHSMVQVYP